MMSAPASAQETTFVVFRLNDVPVGVLATVVDAVRSEVSTVDLSAAGDATRIISLRSQRGVTAPPIRTRGALEVVVLPAAHVVPLPRLCTTSSSWVLAVALREERVRFLIIDPYRLVQADAQAAATASVSQQELL